jgi:hypothetical protein
MGKLVLGGPEITGVGPLSVLSRLAHEPMQIASNMTNENVNSGQMDFGDISV